MNLSQWLTQNNIPVESGVDYYLQLEDWAYCHGFQNEVEITLVSDFLLGLHNGSSAIRESLSPVPLTVKLSEGLRRAFYMAGIKFSEVAKTVSDLAIISFVKDVFVRFNNEISKALADNSIMGSTGDCRGACKFNTGDRSEYRNYGW